MRKIPCFGNEISFEEYARMELLKNVGTHSIAVRDDFLKMCDEEGVEYEKKISKTESLDLLLQNGHTYAELAERFGVGVKSMVYQMTFGISHRDIKRLEKHGVLRVVGHYEFLACGHAQYAPMYSALQFANMTKDEMALILLMYPKGKRYPKKNESKENQL